MAATSVCANVDGGYCTFVIALILVFLFSGRVTTASILIILLILELPSKMLIRMCFGDRQLQHSQQALQ